MKKLLGIVLAMACLIGFGGLGLVATADFVMVDWDFEVQSDDTVAITGYYGTDTDVIVPSTLDGKSVRTIKRLSLNDGNDRIKTFTIPAGITGIHEGAINFYNNSLENVFVDPANPNYRDIGGVLFDRDVTTILAYPPAKQAETYAIPSTVKTIGRFAFAMCPFTSLDIPNGVETINDHAFAYASKLQTLCIPASVSSIDINPFMFSCPEIEVDAANEHFTVSDKVLFTKDFTRLVVYPENLMDAAYTVPDGVTVIGTNAFSYNTKVQTINLPESLVEIEANAISGYGPTSIRIPRNVKTIPINTFINSFNLQAFEVDDANQYFCAVDGVLFSKDMKTLVDYPYGRPATSYIVPDGVSTMAAFRAPALENITIPQSVTNISYFYNEPTIYCYQFSAAHLHALRYGKPYMLLDAETPELKEFSNSGTGVFIRDNTGALDIDRVEATQITSGTTYEAVTNAGLTVIGGYDISLWLGEEEVSPSAPVLVCIPNPYAGTPRTSPAIYWVSDDGKTMERMEVFELGPNREYLAFWASHFSQYIMLADSSSSTTYTLTVVNGSGSGNHAANATVNITANVASVGKVFDKWTTTDGVAFANATAASTSFTMPAKNVTVTATYKDVPKGIFGTNPKWYGEWWHYVLFFFCFGFIWMWF